MTWRQPAMHYVAALVTEPSSPSAHAFSLVHVWCLLHDVLMHPAIHSYIPYARTMVGYNDSNRSIVQELLDARKLC